MAYARANCLHMYMPSLEICCNRSISLFRLNIKNVSNNKLF